MKIQVKCGIMDVTVLYCPVERMLGKMDVVTDLNFDDWLEKGKMISESSTTPAPWM